MEEKIAIFPSRVKIMRLSALCLFVLCVASFRQLSAQQNEELLTLEKNLKVATSVSQKIDAYLSLADFQFINNPQRSDSLALIAGALAESSRDPNIMVTALLRDGARFLHNNGMKTNISQALMKEEKAMTISRQAKDPDLIASCYNLEARIHRGAGETDLALKSNNNAIGLIPDIKSDSLKIYSYAGLARTLRLKSDMLSAFKALLHAQTIAEENKKSTLILYCSRNLEEFYLDIHNYEKAKDYAFKTLKIDESNKDYKSVLQDYIGIAVIYATAKDLDLAKFYYHKGDKLADSLHLESFKLDINLGLVNMYLNNDKFKEGYKILKENPSIFDFLRHGGMQYEIDKANGYIQMMLGHYDSSIYYYKKAEPFHISGATAYQRYNFYHQYMLLFKALKKWDQAIAYEIKALDVIKSVGNLEAIDDATKDLDSLYYYNGDFANAYKYEMLHQQYSDSLRILSEQKDILSLEIDNENKRAEKARILEEEAQVRRHNLQYMGISAAIATIFIVLIILGSFRVSASVVKATGFFAFIFLFEFIIMILDNQIHHLTHGEPWKVWLIKIVLIAMLLPLHHWLEEKAIHFLMEHNLLDSKRLDWMKFKKKSEADIASH